MTYNRDGYEGKRPYGDRKPYGERPYGDKKSYGERSYDDKKSYGERSYGDKKPYGDKRPYGERKPYNERASFERKPFEHKPDRQERIGQEGGEDETPFLIIGRNAVREAVRSGRSIDRILVEKEQDGSLREILNLARDAKLVIREVDRRKLDEITMPFGHGDRAANHQGIVAYAAGVEYCDVRDLLNVAKERGEEPFVIVLDGIMDPHNLGSIIRSADMAGAHGVIIGKRRSASVTAATVKAAAGATEYVKIAKVTNIPAALRELKKAGLWIAGADMAGRPMCEQGMNGALALVIGSEGDGLSKLVADSCDFLVSIPTKGHIDSLNASVAAAVLMFEKKRQDALQ